MAAKKNIEVNPEVLEKRSEQLNTINHIIEDLEREIAQNKQNGKQIALLRNVSEGLYEEIDKLSKKAPAESITDLVLEHVNDVIKETKKVVVGDPYIQKLNPWIAAGDNPQQRDVVVILKQLLLGLERFNLTLKPENEILSRKLSYAQTLQTSLNFMVENKTIPTDHEIYKLGINPVKEWFTTINNGQSQYFDTRKLDSIEILAYFQIKDFGEPDSDDSIFKVAW